MADNLTKAQRSYCMSRVKSKDTTPEKIVRCRLHQRGWRFRKHVKALPGKPDIVFTKAKLAVFIDGGFWHGYKYKEWEHKLSEFWKLKISGNIRRSRANTAALRKLGWKVLRVWQHDVERDIEKVITRIESHLQ